MDFLVDGVIQSELLLQARVSHGVSTKQFGNMSFDRGEAKQVKENMTKFLKVLDLDLEKISLVKLPVNHGTNIVQIKHPQSKGIIKLKDNSDCIRNQHKFGESPGFDSAISHAPQTFLGILPADCAAVMLYSPKTDDYAIIHAGKDGVEAGIIFKSIIMLRRWQNPDPEKFLCYIGPNICPKCYKIGHKSFDLAKEIKYQLKMNLLQDKNIVASRFCTCHHDQVFYSNYRAKASVSEGRQMAIIGRR